MTLEEFKKHNWCTTAFAAYTNPEGQIIYCLHGNTTVKSEYHIDGYRDDMHKHMLPEELLQ